MADSRTPNPAEADPAPNPPEGADGPADPARDLDAIVAERLDEIRAALEAERLADRYEAAVERYGADRVSAAYDALSAAGRDDLATQLLAERNPYAALVQWHARELALQEIGPDPAAYRDRVRAEILADPQVQASLKRGARPANPSALPSLQAIGRSASGEAPAPSPDDAFDAVFRRR